MSLSYTHFLICSSPEFLPDARALVDYVRSIHKGGYIGPNAATTFCVVRERETKTREMTNPFTGETTIVTMPSRIRADEHTIEELPSLADLANEHTEYSVCLRSNQNPDNPPLIVGCDDSDGWTPFDDNYNLEIAIEMRNHLVRLAQLDSEQQLDAPLDPDNLPAPIFDEDCTADCTSGVFVHPELGAYKLSQGGCASFWIEFRYGKFIYPRAVDESVNVLRSEMAELTHNVFKKTFIEASHWG